MAKISIKSILGKPNEISSLLGSLTAQLQAGVFITDESGRVLMGNPLSAVTHTREILLEGECVGRVMGDGHAAIIADILQLFINKESEKKRLGTEVLNLYQEVNLIFNFSERLAQNIDTTAIATTALEESVRVTRAESGVVILWDEPSRRLQVIARQGADFFEEEKLNAHVGLLMKFAFSGKSEILSDLSLLVGAGLVPGGLGSLIYSSLKVNHRIMGAIILAGNRTYSAADLKLLTTLALQSSSAIESALLYEKNIREANDREQAMRHIYEVTEKFVPIEFIASLGHGLITDVRLGDQVEKIVTVLFSDIRDYTSLSEQMTPQENFRFVCSFNEHMGPIIRRHHGFINQYLGDAIMAIFPTRASDALAAAIDMQKAVLEFNLGRVLKNQAPIQIGIGMHSGPLIMGITGDNHRMDATTISDTVNAASRIENLTKYYKTSIIISDASLEQISNADDFYLRPLGLVQVKGKKEPLGIHECFGGHSEEEIAKKSATRDLFCEGIAHYLNKAFSKAFIAFQAVLEVNPGDHTAHFFLGKTAKYITGGVPENWMGVEEMLSK